MPGVGLGLVSGTDAARKGKLRNPYQPSTRPRFGGVWFFVSAIQKVTVISSGVAASTMH